MNRRKSLGGLTALLVLAAAAIGVVIVGVSLIGGNSGHVELLPGPDPANRTPLVRIQDRVITRFDLDVARAYHRLRKGKDGYTLPDYGALLQMMEAAAWEEVLRRHGRPITPEQIAEERARQQKESRDPGTLRDIVALLDRWPGKYEEIMVRAILANQAIMRLHQDKSVQKEAFEAAEAGLQEALRNPDFFRKVKEDSPQKYRMEDTDNPSSVIPPQGVPLPPGHADPFIAQIRKFSDQWLTTTEEGSVVSRVVDGDGEYTVTRLIERNEKRVAYESVIFRKTVYDVWFEGELRKMTGEIPDPDTRALVKEKLSEHMIGRWLLGEAPKNTP